MFYESGAWPGTVECHEDGVPGGVYPGCRGMTSIYRVLVKYMGSWHSPVSRQWTLVILVLDLELVLELVLDWSQSSLRTGPRLVLIPTLA